MNTEDPPAGLAQEPFVSQPLLPSDVEPQWQQLAQSVPVTYTFGDIGSVRVVETKAQTVTIQPAINKPVSYPIVSVPFPFVPPPI